MATKHQKFEVDLPGYTSEEREAIALEIIQRVIRRTQSGKDKNGDSFAKYSPKNPKEGKVDLTLSGDMLASIELIQRKGKKVVIGFEKGSEENGKADGNIRGTYGQQAPIKGGKYARDFLGISGDELNQILARYPKGTGRSKERAAKRLQIEADAQALVDTIDV